jgi:hypothetical protein
MPYKLITHRAGKIEKISKSLNENSIFDQIYLESLNKFTKMYLINKYTRVNKTKSLKSQLKNLIEGIMSSNRKRNGNFIEFSADNLVEVIINDLETYGVIMCGLNIHYNDQAIDEFFGEFKSKVFVPCHKLPSVQVIEKSNKEVVLKPNKNSSSLETSASDFKKVEDLKRSNLVNTHKLDLERTQENSSKVLERFKKPAQNFMFSVTPKGPESNLSSQFYPAISKPVPLIASINQKIWQQHEPLILKQVTQVLLENFGQVDNILKLFRICNRTVRDYITSTNLIFEDFFITDIVRKTTETLADKYFTTENSLSFTEFFQKIDNSVPIKLYKKLN